MALGPSGESGPPLQLLQSRVRSSEASPHLPTRCTQTNGLRLRNAGQADYPLLEVNVLVYWNEYIGAGESPASPYLNNLAL